MNEIIDRVGQALREKCLKRFGATWDNDDAWLFARAAIEAMRLPTDEMRAAGNEELDYDERISPQADEFNQRVVGRIFTAMIDAALDP